MKINLKFFSFWLLLFLCTITILFNSCRKAVAVKQDSLTFDEGVMINGVKWATRNVDALGIFVTKPEDPGMFYQWNRKKAWSAIGKISGWDSSNPTGDSWAKANDPSPAGWRVPTAGEIKTLVDTDKVSYEWTTQNGVSGGKFTDKVSGNSIFLPAVGCRGNDYGMLERVGSDGAYWSSTASDNDYAFLLGFYDGHAFWSNYGYCGYGLLVRAVAK